MQRATVRARVIVPLLLSGLARPADGRGLRDRVFHHENRRSGGQAVRRFGDRPRPPVRLTDTVAVVTNDAMSPLFEAVIEATEEAIFNSLLRAETVKGFRGTAYALPIDSTSAILRRHGMLRD